MEPLHIDDNANDSDDINGNANDFDDIHDTIRMMPTRGADDDLNDYDYDNDDDPNDYDYDDDNDDTKDGDDTDYEDNDIGNDDDTDDDHDTDDNNDTENDGYDSENNDCDSKNDDYDSENDGNDSLRTDNDDSPLRDYDDDEPQDLDDHVDQKHLISNETTIMNRMLMPHFTFTPPSPQVGDDRPQLLRIGHEDDFANYVTRSPFLRVPEAPRGTSSADSPPFFRLAPVSEQPGKSGEEFANRMSTKWNSLRSRRRAVHKGSRDVVPDDGTYFRPTKLRRIMEEN
jgi:hypothetical protein